MAKLRLSAGGEQWKTAASMPPNASGIRAGAAEDPRAESNEDRGVHAA
ncbi:MAG: hypothetical protein LBB61_08270 [Treponema sp.]|nr:hypothetical protein [Treponema sp.]